MKAGSETKRKRRIRLAGAVPALLAASVLLLPSAAGAEIIRENASVQSQMDALIRKSGNPAGAPGTMSELTVNTGIADSVTSLPGIVYDAAGQVVGYSSGQGTSQSSYAGSSNTGSSYPGSSYPGSGSSGTSSGNTPGYANLVPSGQAASSSSGYILNVNSTSRSSGESPSYIISGSSDRITGPGAKLVTEPGNRNVVTLENSVNSGTSTQNGPAVTEVTPRESRFEDYGVYSEAMSDSLFFYSTVANNSMTDQPVTLEYPSQMICTAEKDGVPFTYTSGTAVSGYGTYVMKFLVVTNPGAPVISQNVLRSVFTFRIREKTAEAKAAAAEEVLSTIWPDGIQGLETLPFETEETSTAEPAEPETAEAEPAETEPAETEPAETEPETPGAGNAFYHQEYDAETGLYRITLPDGRFFTSTVLNGFLSPYAVELDLSGLGRLDGVRLLENGEVQPVKDQLSLNYAGNYMLLIPTPNGTAPFSVRMPGEKTRSIGRYTVPEGVKVLSMTKNGRNVPGADTADTLDFSEDAVYALKLEDMAGSDYDLAFEVDSEAPQFTVTVGKGSADITYQSDDVAIVALTKSDGNSFRYEAPIGTVNEPGSYRITVMDEAGNRSTDTFTIRKQINPATPIAVILLLGLIGGGAWFFRRTRMNTSVR